MVKYKNKIMKIMKIMKNFQKVFKKNENNHHLSLTIDYIKSKIVA